MRVAELNILALGQSAVSGVSDSGYITSEVLEVA